MKIFHLDCSINSFENSLTRKHSKMIVDRLASKNQNPSLYYIDLVKADIPFLTKEYQRAMFKPATMRSEQDIAVLDTFNIRPFVEADIYVMGAWISIQRSCNLQELDGARF